MTAGEAKKRPWLAVDCIVFDDFDNLLVVYRKHPPFIGKAVLPGGFVESGETVEQAALRELEEETGVNSTGALHLVGVYSDPNRDPRRHVVSVAFLILPPVPCGLNVRGGDDAAAAAFVAWKDLELAFDHNHILADACRLRSQLRG